MQETFQKIWSEAARRNLPCLLIGGNAMIVYGYPRNTIDLDLLIPESSRSGWLDLLRDLGFRLLHGTDAFAQFEPATDDLSPVDLMLVDARTWELLNRAPITRQVMNFEVTLPRPEHLVALKLHAARSATRHQPELDWEDIRQLIRLQKLDWRDPAFQNMIQRFAAQTPWCASNPSTMKMNPAEVAELNFPDFPEAPREHLRAMRWEDVMRETKALRDYYRQHHDSPEKRLAGKNPEPFRLE